MRAETADDIFQKRQKQTVLGRLIEPGQQIAESRKIFSNKALFTLILPIVVEQLLALLVGIADTLMVSYAGEAAVSGVSLVNQLNNVFILVFSALASGGAVIASQYVGRQDQENGARASSQLLMITTLISLVLMGIALIFRTGLLRLLFGQVETDVMDACVTYLVLSAYSFPFLAIYNACAGLYRSMNKSNVVMNISLAMNGINVVGNAIGIFVLHAGVAGVAIPSLISRIFAAVVMLILIRNPNNTLYIRARDIFSWNGSMLRRILHVSIPNGVENGLFQISKVALSSIVALFGTSQIAANGVAQSFWSVASLFCIALGYAFVTVIGQCMGKNDAEAADYYQKKLLRITYLGGGVWNLLILALTPLMLRLYSLSDETVRYVLILVAIHNLSNLVLAPVAFSLANGLRAAGDIRYTMFAAVFSTVVCRVFFSLLFGIWMDMGVIGIALAMVADWLIKAALIAARYRSKQWTKFQVI